MTFEYGRLKGRIVEKFGSQKAFAQKIGCAEATITKKLNNFVNFDTEEIVLWCDSLDIDYADIPSYFFVLCVQKNEQQ